MVNTFDIYISRYIFRYCCVQGHDPRNPFRYKGLRGLFLSKVETPHYLRVTLYVCERPRSMSTQTDLYPVTAFQDRLPSLAVFRGLLMCSMALVIHSFGCSSRRHILCQVLDHIKIKPSNLDHFIYSVLLSSRPHSSLSPFFLSSKLFLLEMIRQPVASAMERMLLPSRHSLSCDYPDRILQSLMMNPGGIKVDRVKCDLHNRSDAKGTDQVSDAHRSSQHSADQGGHA